MFVLKCNTISKFEYLKDLIAYVVVAMLWYINICFKNVQGLTTTYSLQLLIAFTTLYIFIIYELSLNWNRNIISILESAVIPFGAYSLLTGFDVISIETKLLFFGVLFVCCIICLVAFFVSRRIGAKQTEIVIQMLYIIGKTILALCSIVIIAISTYSAKNTFIAEENYDSHKSFVEKDKIIDEKMEVLSQIYDDNWLELSFNDRLDVLNCYSEVESVYLGINRAIPVKAKCLDKNEHGYYMPQEHTIYISMDVILSDETKYILEVLLHEMYHAAQHRYVEIYKSLVDEDRDIVFMQNASNYAEEFDNYISGLDKNKYEEYHNQNCEIDAREYSAQGANDYYFHVGQKIKGIN